jgi:hypothetical protein
MNSLANRVSFWAKFLGVFLFVSVIGNPHTVRAAQDSVFVTGVDKQQGSGWFFEIKNANSQNLPINNFFVTFSASDGSTVGNGGYGPGAWIGNPSDNADTIYYTTTGNSVLAGQTVTGFEMAPELNTPDVPYTFYWSTYSNSTLVSSGSFTVFYTAFQNETSSDTATVVASQRGTDPVFRFNVENLNSFQSQIGRVSFQLLDPTYGTIRPSYLRAPAGWNMDSATSSTVYFSGLEGNIIDVDQSLDSFIIALRANPAVTEFGWVMRCYRTQDTVIIDRDTIRNIAASGSVSATTSNDSVTATKDFGCLYNINLENFHTSNLKPASRITTFVLYGSTAGVTFAAVPTFPTGWNKSISANQDTVTFQAGSDGAGIPSGVVASSFGISMNNPSNGPFTLNWITKYKYPTQQLATVSSGALSLTCAAGALAIDSASVGDGNQTCGYILTAKNVHNNPPSPVYGISLAITDGSGTFDMSSGSLSTSLGWDQTGTSSAVRFSVPSASTNFQASGTNQLVYFSVIPKKSGVPVNIVWQTYDQNQVQIEGAQSFSVTCSPVVVALCDSVSNTTPDMSVCKQDFSILNRHAGDIISVKMAPNSGWLIDSSAPPLGWTSKIDGSKTFVTYTSSQGIPSGVTQDGFFIWFTNPGKLDSFIVATTTSTTDSNCTTSLQMNCLASSVQFAGILPSSIKLTARPNPFQTSTELGITLPMEMHVDIQLLDILGKSRMVIKQGTLSEGDHSFRVDSASLGAGTYYVRVQTPVGVTTKKIVMTR